MMLRYLDRVFNLDQYTSRSERDRMQLTMFIVLTALIFSTIYALQAFGSVNSSLFERALQGNVLAIISLNCLYIFGLLTLLDIRQGWRSLLVELGPMLMLLGSGVLLDINGGLLSPTSTMSLVGLILLGALTMRLRAVVIGFALALGALVIGLIQRDTLAASVFIPNSTQDLLVGGLYLLAALALLMRFLRNISIAQRESIEQIDVDRLRLATLTTQIAQRISGRANLNELLNTAVDEIVNSYAEIYHAQVFLIDEEGRSARLIASTGEPGRLLLARQHTLDVGSRSVIGQVTQAANPIIARTGSSNTVHRRNEFLPETVVEAAFPLQVGGRVIGALDLQSKLKDAFPDEQAPVFQSLADTIAIAIDNARLLEEAERRVRENERLVEQTQRAARQVEQLNRELTARTWDEYLEQKGGQIAINIDFQRVTANAEPKLTATLERAITDNHVVQTDIGNITIISAPLRVRGHVIGAIEFELPGGTLTPEQLDLVQAVADRFGTAVETTRAYEISRRAAQREAMINDIGSRLQGRNRVETVLEEAARGLQQSIGAQRVAIRLTPRRPLEVTENGGA